MNVTQRELLLKSIQVLLKRWGKKPEFPDPSSGVSACKLQILERPDNAAEDEFEVNHDCCKSSERAQAEAEFFLNRWIENAEDEEWLNQRNARELNGAGCLYIWVQKDYQQAAELFLKAHGKATDEEKKPIEENLALIQPFV